MSGSGFFCATIETAGLRTHRAALQRALETANKTLGRRPIFQQNLLFWKNPCPRYFRCYTKWRIVVALGQVYAPVLERTGRENRATWNW
jgi:hypothetical protein